MASSVNAPTSTKEIQTCSFPSRLGEPGHLCSRLRNHGDPQLFGVFLRCPRVYHIWIAQEVSSSLYCYRFIALRQQQDSGRDTSIGLGDFHIVVACCWYAEVDEPDGFAAAKQVWPIAQEPALNIPDYEGQIRDGSFGSAWFIRRYGIGHFRIVPPG